MSGALLETALRKVEATEVPQVRKLALAFAGLTWLAIAGKPITG